MENNEQVYSLDIYKSFVGVKFDNGTRAYFFGVKKEDDIDLDDKVVVETSRGLEIGTVVIKPIDISNYSSELGLKPILRKASKEDLLIKESNIKDAESALKICQSEVTKLGLDMHLISCEYTLDKTKVIFSYLADERVDFRELLKVLASKLRTRIELRQIGSRDKAKMIGGIGMCGLPLCCATFLNEFEGISISRAKNQMLAINIPKLSGHCDKLLCCLKYEDDAYTDAKKEYPDLGSKVRIDEIDWTVTNINIVSTIIKLEGGENEVRLMTLEDFRNVINPKSKKIERRFEEHKEEPKDIQKEPRRQRNNKFRHNRNFRNRKDNNEKN